MKNNYTISHVEVISTMMNINIDIEIEGKWYEYNAEWDYKERYATISGEDGYCLLYTSPSPRDATLSRMPSSA